ncbi:MAG: hypothetical protein JEZ07_07240 [Phycisphaerae bacterium]|nr:hypothetical protein [Phycisphaerae bacterium]
MIAKITGKLESLDTKANTIYLSVGDICYEILVPAYAVTDLSARLDSRITLSTLQYFEGNMQGSNMVPILLGFPHNNDKAFFQRFISVKGIGIRKALRALAKPLADIAYAIEQGDTKWLILLPEVGKRTAEQIVAELKGKMADYATASTSPVAGKAHKPHTPIETEALDILIQLGEKPEVAEALIERVMTLYPEIKTTDTLVQAVYKHK